MDLGEQTDVSPNQPFRSESQSQFQPQFPYSQGTSTFTLDQDMNMGSDTFAAAVQAHADRSLDNSASRSGSAQGALNIGASASGMSTPGMAPPQGINHAYSPGGVRPSLDEGQDGNLSGGDPKRKRSKVSRACDECRRKKVRCDAAADDGTIKTCSNCQRAGLTCEYSRIPMKRGPSKGYIKELSERVQQVESLQMALSNTPGYRQSLDATSGVFAETPYSPDDPMSLKRNFSFSAEQRSPFVGPEYHRDRMPSLGGWNSSSPHSANFRARDRGSIAIAPDQQPTTQISFSKPFWAQDIEGPPPAKRQKMNSDDVVKPDIDQALLNNYYREIHTYLPIMPDADVAIAIIGKASPKVQCALAEIIHRLSLATVDPKDGNTNKEDELNANVTSTVFKSRQELEDFMWNAARESPETRSAEDNLLLIWIYLLMAVEAENDLSRLHDGPLPRTVLIKQSVDLGWFCVTSAASKSDSPQSSDLGGGIHYLQEFARAWHCATIPARLHALAVGSGNPIPRYYHQRVQKKVPSLYDVLPIPGIVVALSAIQFTIIGTIVQDSLPPSSWGRNADAAQRVAIQDIFDGTIDTRAYSSGNEALLEQLRFFLDLTLSRYSENFHPMDIVIPATALAESLRKTLVATKGNLVYNPFRLHFFALTTITLLEFLSEGRETHLFRMATAGLEDMKIALEQVSERDHAADIQQGNENEAEASGMVKKPIYWSDALLKMIEERLKHVAATHANGAGPRTLGDGTAATVDFSLLLRYGYLTVLAQQAG